MHDTDRSKSSKGSWSLSRFWDVDPAAYRGIKRYFVKNGQIAALVARDFLDDGCFIHASALSFTTILSLVPFFAVTFAVLKGLGVPNTLEPFIIEQMAAGSEEVVDRIISYINNTNMKSLGAIGLVLLLFTVISLLGNIEATFNSIWGVKETRSIYRKFSDYLSVVISAPLLLLAATSVTTTLQSQAVVQWFIRKTYFGDLLLFGFRLVPYLSIWVAMVFLYIFIPNTKVRFKSALIGGVLAGTSWELAQWGYIHFQVGVARYNAIYGTLSLLPIFMIWIYTSWLIVLFGLEVVYAHQNIRTFRREDRHATINYASREMLTLIILLNIAEAFYHEQPPWQLEQLAEELDLPVRVVREIVEAMVAAGYLVETAGEQPAYLPARELEHIQVSGVIATLKNAGDVWMPTRLTRERSVLEGVLAKVEASSSTALAEITLKELVMGLPAVGAGQEVTAG